MAGSTDRPERRTRTLRNGDTVYEAGDCRFVASPSETVHVRPPSDDPHYDYAYHPECGQRLPSGSLWQHVDADDPEEAVLKYNLRPCTKCFSNSLRLERWRKDVHSSIVVHDADTPERWLS